MALAIAMIVTVAAGCSGFADEVRADRQQGEGNLEETMETARGLYDSMVEVFEEDTAGVEQAVEESLVVISRYESLEGDRRRRFVGQIVPLRGGIGVRITAEYQVENSQVEGGWEDEPREAVRLEAEPLELSLARSVERRYHSGGD